MNPPVMIALIALAHAVFAWSAIRRWQLLQIGKGENRFDKIEDRILAVWNYAFKQEKMDYYQPAGWAHKLIFAGFITLTLRTLVLWGRGIYPSWNLFILGPSQPVGKVYEFAKDLVAILVVVGVSVFFYFHIIQPQKHITLNKKTILILVIIFTMMITDMMYDGASMVLAYRQAELCAPDSVLATVEQCKKIATITAPYPMGTEAHASFSFFPSPAGSAFATAFKGLPAGALILLAQIGFWTHSSLVLIFLNLLPHSKHFHVITAIPNVFLKSMDPPGRLKPMAESTEKLMEKLEAAAGMDDPLAGEIGVARIDQFTWKAVLDFYTCTECGRCSDNCPAHRTGKVLSPKHLTLALRDHLYDNEAMWADKEMRWGGADPNLAELGIEGDKSPEQRMEEVEGSKLPKAFTITDLVPNIVHPDVLWACTTCRACEEQCPVMISYVDKIVDMRRNLVMVKNEFPHELAKPFQAMEVNGNPWNLSRMDRSAWSDGLDIPMMSDKPDAEVLYWVGCAASYDDRAKKIARSTAKLLKAAGVDFAILGQEETCTGDPARRAGNELLFATLAETNAAVLNTYKEQGGAKTVITACPHCFNTIKNEYPDFGAKVDVVHHTDFLMGLLAMGKLKPTKPVTGKVVFHDSCYLGRYNGVYESPREILRSIPGVELVEPEYWTKQRGLCCGAGGAQMWMEEQNATRVNVKRTLQLVDTGAKTIASGCPFCMTMLTDGLKSQSLEEKIQQLDVAELLERSCISEELPSPAPEEEAAAAEE